MKNRQLIVPTLCVGMPVLTLCVLFRDAEPQWEIRRLIVPTLCVGMLG